MSSHHIVRDAQEPALIIAGSFPFEQAEPLLEWSPVVIVLADYLEEVLSWEIKIDVIVMPIEQATLLEAKLAHQMPIMFIFDQPTPLRAALEYLKSNEHKTISILGKNPSSLTVSGGNDLELIFYEEDYKLFRPSGGIFKKWVIAGTSFKIENSPSLKTQNLAQTATHWQAINTGFVEIHSTEDDFWIGEKVY
jgi:thiamine pyrophosphokinase